MVSGPVVELVRGPCFLSGCPRPSCSAGLGPGASFRQGPAPEAALPAHATALETSGLARGGPGRVPQTSTSARLPGDEVTDGGRALPPPTALGRSGPARLGTARQTARLIPVALCQGPGGRPRGDTTWAWVGSAWGALVALPVPTAGGQEPQRSWPTQGHGGWGLGMEAAGRGDPGDRGQCVCASPVTGGRLALGRLVGSELLLCPGCGENPVSEVDGTRPPGRE